MKLAIVVASSLVAGRAASEPLRLRADALASTASPAGLLVLEADGDVAEGVDAEAVVWMAGSRALDDSAAGDVLVATVHGSSANGRAHARLGRFVSTLGALRPTHVDGGSARLRLPGRLDVELVGGVPVMPADDVMGSMTARSWDWYAAGRISRRLGEWGALGLGYGQRRDAGIRASEELAADAGFTLGKRDDVGARVAYDLANPGVAEVRVTASHRTKALRTDVYASHLAASHLLPATSLFTVLGDVPSQRAGVLATWRAAPRLDLIADAGVRHVDAIGVELAGRARLRLDDRGTSALTGELRRSGIGDDAWTGVRGAARIALRSKLSLATELELVIPDVDRGTGAAWPWALCALGWERGDWETAVAIEASSSPQYTGRIDILGQLSRRWGKPR